MIKKLLLFSTFFFFLFNVTSLQAEENIARVPLNKKRTAAFRFQTQSKCYMGDLDVISLEMNEIAKQRAPESMPEVILSFEPVTNDTNMTKPISRYLSAGEVSAKDSFEIEFPKVTSPVLAAVYICIGNKRERCAGKPVIAHEEFLKRYALKITPKNKMGKHQKIEKKVSDKIYFARYLVIDKDAVYFANSPMTEEAYKELKDLLAKLAPKKPYGEEIHELRRLGILGSVPLSYKDNAINITLPFYDYKRCFPSRKK